MNFPDYALTPNDDRDSYSNFLNDWDAFYTEFVQSTTYTLACSDKATLSSLPITDDDDNDSLMNEGNATKTPTLLNQLCPILRELEKVNWQLFHLLKTLSSPAPCLQPNQHSANNPQQPPMCHPHPESIPQCIVMHAPPPAPNPAAILWQQPLPPLAPRRVMTDHDQPNGFSSKPPWPPKAKSTTIPPWEKPVVHAGDTHWPPP